MLAPPVIPLANKTREDFNSCWYLANLTATPNLAICWSMAMAHDITPEDEITAPREEDIEAPPNPHAAGKIENCTESYHSCESLLLTTWLEFDDFYRMNPSDKSDCTGLAVGTYYCISTNEDGSPPLLEDTTTASASATATATDVVIPSPV
ncbi:hypothetical protein QQX98_003551 [Neonectria punicea]|uniref:LysM domain-containing protein n=1 Tax=Neonectria punicea TaxID=979145 RepID=A0ABR1HD02_9HYPO